MCCHTEIEVADQTFYLTQSQYTDTGLTSPSADPIMPGAWQGSHWRANFWVTGMTRPRKIMAQVGFKPGTFRSRGGRLTTRPTRRHGKGIHLKSSTPGFNSPLGGRNSSVGSAWAHCHSVAGSILLWGHFPVEGNFPLELTWVQTPFPQNSFGWEYKPRSSLCTHAFHRTDSKDPDVHVVDGWMPATKTHPARTIHEDGMWLP